ncbi:MAG: DUF2442 domain-containing protein [Vulcanimicrobiaceae bacterium]
MATKAPTLTKAQYDAATRRGEGKANLPSALVAAALDEKAKAVRLRFRAGIELAIPIKAIDEIAKAPIAMLRDVKASPIGDGLIFSEFGEAIYVPGLLRDLFGDAFAGALGKIGGRSRSDAKARAARKNGRKGGRPRKVAA